jgi:hypothetical protein
MQILPVRLTKRPAVYLQQFARQFQALTDELGTSGYDHGGGHEREY